eukprot:1303040-Rhodomonas_salina.1
MSALRTEMTTLPDQTAPPPRCSGSDLRERGVRIAPKPLVAHAIPHIAQHAMLRTLPYIEFALPTRQLLLVGACGARAAKEEINGVQ